MPRPVMMRASPYVLLLFTALFWGGNWVIARGLEPSMSPIAMSFWRWFLALVILLPFVGRSMLAERRAIAGTWKAMTLLAILGVSAFSVLSYTGLKYTMASNALLLQSVTPVLILTAGYLFFAEAVQPRQAVGVFLSVAGLAVIVARGELRTLLTLSVNRGDLWVLGAMAVWAAYTVCLRWRPSSLSSPAFTGTLMSIGVLTLAPLFVWDYWRGARTHWSGWTLAAVGYFALFPSVLAYFFWNRGVSEIGPGRAGFFMYLVPVFGIILAVIFLHEPVSAFHAVGMALIFGGIYLASKRSDVRENARASE